MLLEAVAPCCENLRPVALADVGHERLKRVILLLAPGRGEAVVDGIEHAPSLQIGHLVLKIPLHRAAACDRGLA